MDGPHGDLVVELIMDGSLSGIRVDKFLAHHFRNYTSYRLARIVRAGCVLVNHGVAMPDTRVFTGQLVSARLIEPPDKLFDPVEYSLEIPFEDGWLAVVNKPAGLIAHPVGDFQEVSLAHVFQAYLDRQTIRKGLLRPGIVHRLDRLTSGAIVVAKDHHSHRELSLQFQSRQISKRYFALVEGTVEQSSGVIDLPLGRAKHAKSLLMSARADARDRKPAKTQFEVLKRYGDCSLVEAVPLTGRNHQIRVHLAAIGHPVLGDEFYGPLGTLKEARPESEPGSQPTRHWLHAHRVGFAHPITGDWLEIEVPPPADFFDEIGDDSRCREQMRRVTVAD